MADKRILEDWVLDALRSMDGEGTVVQVAEWIWRNHEDGLRRSGTLFYTWQYDMRWAAQNLRDRGTLLATRRGPSSVWRLGG